MDEAAAGAQAAREPAGASSKGGRPPATKGKADGPQGKKHGHAASSSMSVGGASRAEGAQRSASAEGQRRALISATTPTIPMDGPVKDFTQGTFTLEFDGASRGNPGHSGAGALIRADDGRVVHEISEYLGHTTVNTAEYRALLAGLRTARDLHITSLAAQGDSMLVVAQIKGEWRVKGPQLKLLKAEATKFIKGFTDFSIRHVPRRLNGEADALANRAIDEGTIASKAVEAGPHVDARGATPTPLAEAARGSVGARPCARREDQVGGDELTSAATATAGARTTVGAVAAEPEDRDGAGTGAAADSCRDMGLAHASRGITQEEARANPRPAARVGATGPAHGGFYTEGLARETERRAQQRRCNPDRRQSLPSTPAEWAEDVDLAMLERGQWVSSQLIAAHAAAKDGGIAIVGAFCGLATEVYGAVMAGWRIVALALIDVDEGGDGLDMQRAALLLNLSQRFPAQLAGSVIADTNELGNDIFEVSHAKLEQFVRRSKAAALAFVFTWPCNETSLVREQRPFRHPDRRTDTMLDRALVLKGVARQAAAQAGMRFFALGENTPIVLEGDYRYDKLSEAEKDGRMALRRYIRENTEHDVLCDAALLSALHRLRFFCTDGFTPDIPPRVPGRRMVDVLERHQRPKLAVGAERGYFERFNIPGEPRVKGVTAMRDPETRSIRDGSALVLDDTSATGEALMSLPGLAAGLGFYAPWLDGGLIMDSPALRAGPDAEGRMRRALGGAVDAQNMTWWFALMLRAAYVTSTIQGAEARQRLQLGRDPLLRCEGERPARTRASQSRDPEDYVFRHAGRYVTDGWSPTDGDDFYDVACSASLDNMQPFCTAGFSRAHTVQRHWRELIGRVWWGNLPFSQTESMVSALLQAHEADPARSRGTLLVALRGSAPWYRRWVAAKMPRLRLVRTWPIGTKHVFSRPGLTRRAVAGPTPEPLALLRLGHTPAEIADKERGSQEANDAFARIARGCRSGDEAQTGREQEADRDEHDVLSDLEPNMEDVFWRSGAPHGEAEASPPESKGDGEQQSCAEHVEWQALKAEAALLLKDWLPRHNLAQTAGWLDRWRAGTLESKTKDPGAWFGPRDGRLAPGGGRLYPRRWQHWHQHMTNRYGADSDAARIAGEAADIAVNDVAVPLAWRPPRVAHTNTKSCDEYRGRIEGEFRWYREAIAVEYCPADVPPEDFVDIVAAGLVALRYPDDGKGRFCLSLTKAGVTEAIIARAFSLPTAQRFLCVLMATDWLLRVDMGKAFYNTKLQEMARRLVGFIDPLNGQLARFTVPVFGLRMAPEVLYVITTTVRNIGRELATDAATYLRARGHTWQADELDRAAEILDPYADDFICNGHRLALAMLHLILYAEAENTGVAFDPEKDVVGSEVVILGALISAPGLHMRIAPRKRRAYSAFLTEFIDNYDTEAGGSCPRREMERLRGRLGFCAALSRWARVFLAPLDEALFPQGRPSALGVVQQCTWGPDLHSDLTQLWRALLDADNAEALQLSQWAAKGATQTSRHVTVAVAGAQQRPDDTDVASVREWVTFAAMGRHSKKSECDPLALARALKGLRGLGTNASTKQAVMQFADKRTSDYVNKGTGGFTEAKPLLRAIALAAIEQRWDVRAECVPISLAPQTTPISIWWNSNVPKGPTCGPEYSSDCIGDGPKRSVVRSTCQDAKRRCMECTACGDRLHALRWIACKVCRAKYHRECAMVPESAPTWTCAACLAASLGGRNPWDLTKAAALLARSRAEGTMRTYGCSLKRFVRVVQLSAARRHNVVSEDDVLPPKEDEPIPEGAVLAFIGEAEGAYATVTVEGTLAALNRWTRVKSAGRLQGPGSSFRVKEAMAGLRRAHRGTVKGQTRAAFAMTPAFTKLVISVALSMSRRAEKEGKSDAAYAHSRDALFYAIAFFACLRKSEAARLTWDDFTAGAVENTTHLFICYSKNDQSGVGVTLPVALATKSGFNLGEQIARHKALLQRLGVRSKHLFGIERSPQTRLKSVDSMLRRLRRVYFAELGARGVRISNDVRFAGHSFRRGGINAIRDAARRAGKDDAALHTLLLRYGRWRDVRSLHTYLNDNWAALSGLTAAV